MTSKNEYPGIPFLGNIGSSKLEVIPLPNVRHLNSDKYNISKYRFRELYYFCLQYNEWKEELKSNVHTVKSIQISDMPSSHSYRDQTADLAERRASLQEKCELIEQTAIETDPELYQYIIEAVTCDYATYNYLSAKGMPWSRSTYFRRRRLFYWLLSRKI